MKYSYNYNTELENILNEIYKNKIYIYNNNLRGIIPISEFVKNLV